MPFVAILCLICTLFLGCVEWFEMDNTTNSPPAEKDGYVLDWQDEFDNNDLDATWWLANMATNVCEDARMADYEVSNGTLKLRINPDHPSHYENGSTTGFKVSGIETYNCQFNALYVYGTKQLDDSYKGYTTQYGYFEIRCKMPSCDGGGHVAFWMQGARKDTEDGKGSVQTGEIDILETPFYAPNAHFTRVFQWTDENLTDWYKGIPLEGDYVNEWHTFALDWRPEYLAFYVDGVEVSRTEQSPQYEVYLILSMYIDNGTDTDYVFGPPSDIYPKEWEIDYVRVYKDENGYGSAEEAP